MYKNRKLNKNSKTAAKENVAKKRGGLSTIDENAMMKIQRLEVSSNRNDGSKAVAKEPGNLDEMFSSEENIPASQEPTQRYLSQRSMQAGTLCRTQSRSLTQRPPNTYFELVLMKAGVQLDEADNFVLSCDHVAFVGKFREILVKSQNYPENIETFKTGLRDALNAKSKLVQKLLSGCTISIPGEETTYQSQDSMMVNFLIIDFLRQHVLEVLLDKIEEAACGSSTVLINNTIPLLPLLLAQLRYVTLSHGDLIYMRIKHIFEQSTDAAKWDIIASSEFIIDSVKHDEFAQMLLDHMPSSKDIFNTNTVQTLTNLCLSPKLQGKIRTKMLAFIKENQCPNQTLPLLIRFLLKILNEDNDECVRALITSLREILIWKTTTNQDVLDKQTQVELFHYIEQGLTRSKRFYDIWQKTIAAMSASQIRSFDFVILLLLIKIKEDRALYIENSLRRRIKLEHINVDILKDTKSKFSAILDLHTNTLMQILHDFLRDKQRSVSDFAKGSYSILFEIGDSIQKNILKKLLELTCDKSAQNMTNLALELLKELHRKYTKEVQNWGMLLMPLLDRLSEMSLSQTRLVMELLCSIAYPAPNLSDCPVLQDQIDMLVKKQIISRTSTVKKQGIIGSVQLIDSIARIEETVMVNMDDLNITFSTVSDLPDGRGKIAAQYIVRLHSFTMHCPESLALFYDELASVCAASPNERSNAALPDKSFLMWLCELMTYYFQNSFVAEHSPETTLGIKLSYQKCINTIEDTNTEESELPAIAINIAELVLKPAADASSSILVLAPLFNLVRVLHLQRYEGSLELINALLGCAIILPTFFDDPEAAFCDYDSEQRKNILDIYFHCVNWIRETVSSFTTQREDMIRSKVLIRLSDLIQIEDKIRKLLHGAPADYTPPVCQFLTEFAQSTTPKTTCGGRSRPPTGTNQKPSKSSNKHNQTESEALVSFNETNIGNNTIVGRSNKNLGGSKHSFDQLYGPKQIYRQMDSNIMLILREKLVINYPLPIEEAGKGIGLLEYRFVLHDLVSKLESVTGVQKYTSEESLQYIAKPLYFMMDLSKFLHAISCNMEVLTAAINERVESAKHVYGHADLFTDDINYLKVNLGLSLRLLAAYYSWSQFVDTGVKTVELLKESLLALLEPLKCKQFKANSSNLIARELFKKFHKYDAYILDLKTAVFLYQLLLNFRKLSHDTETVEESVAQKQAHEIRNLCKSFLLRKWYNYDGTMEKGATCNIYLNELVKGFLKNSDFRRQREILRIVLDETKQLGGKDSVLKSFPNFKKANFPLLFRGLCEILITSLSDVIVTQSGDANDKLRIWEKSCELLNMLLEILQALDVPRNFQLFLKYSHMYLKLVLQHGLQIFEQFVRQNPERVSDLLKSLQVTTRFLHNLSCHSKALKNTAIVSQIPFLRETIETLVFRVKALLVANKCASVFWMGNLKNKDLHGDELLSQSSSMSAAGQESDEEIPDDDVSVDETLLGQDESTRSDNIADARVNSDRSKSSSRSKCF